MTGEDGYRVERSGDGETWSLLAGNVAADTTTYTDGSGAGALHAYRVIAIDGDDESAASPVAVTGTSSAAIYADATTGPNGVVLN